ncbi:MULTISPECIES: urea ABC transporter ATP-binding subunit UrtE [Methylophaga]|uniref:High-affinity branched-chain amino acid transport ATP-binding protein LivF n=1 Tax=Methylophaga muralis TaxID=291169 RepID=A0A1E3GRH8_9GAMM|nr:MULTISPECIES: urea ABC transporter ATP-binding subunit UrtE [Methylophaga]ODN66555.1 High-affinity branched-chain amino acid transport ATP-binding protein LivF [Methylophaga muralis]THK41494.1 urea ABC transporter ATP-binding subunit UrtE [Methylophaga sp. SB9B]
MLQLESVNSFYGGSHILHDINLEIEKGKIFAVLGRNGVGKSTLLKTIMGLTSSMTGKLLLNEDDLSTKTTFSRARAGIGYVPQGREIIPDFSVKENILMGRFADINGKVEIPELVPELFPYLMDNLNRAGGLLSGGQQQQLAIARALATNPDILLLDEPTEGIQPNIVEQIEECIITLNQKLNLTIILVEQNIRFAKRASHGFVFLDNGRVVLTGKGAELTDELANKHLTI